MDAVWKRLNFEALLVRVLEWVPGLIVGILILIGFWILYRATRGALTGLLTRAGFDAALVNMMRSVYRFALTTFGLVMAASQLGINVGAALAGLGVVGLTIGFAAKDSLSNIMAGFLIFWDKPFHVGDWVTLDSKYGQVSEITMRTTRLRTRDNTWVIVPNEAVINRVLVNHSTRGMVRLNVPVGIAYGASIQDARRVLIERITQMDKVLKDPAPTVTVAELGESSVNLSVHAWTADAADEKPLYAKVAENIKDALDAAGIEIPFPQMHVSLEGSSKIEQ